MAGKRVHYSRDAQSAVDASELGRCKVQNFVGMIKPRGLWYDVPTMPCGGDGWRAYCLRFGWMDRIQYANEMEVDEDKIFKITNERDLLRFLRDWCRPGAARLKVIKEEDARQQVLQRDPTLLDLFDQIVQDQKLYNAPIDFPALALEYSGLEITPYVYDWPWRITLDFFHGWDCSSGVIWDPNAITSFGPAVNTSEWPTPDQFFELSHEGPDPTSDDAKNFYPSDPIKV